MIRREHTIFFQTHTSENEREHLIINQEQQLLKKKIKTVLETWGNVVILSLTIRQEHHTPTSIAQVGKQF